MLSRGVVNCNQPCFIEEFIRQGAVVEVGGEDKNLAGVRTINEHLGPMFGDCCHKSLASCKGEVFCDCCHKPSAANCWVVSKVLIKVFSFFNCGWLRRRSRVYGAWRPESGLEGGSERKG